MLILIEVALALLILIAHLKDVDANIVYHVLFVADVHDLVLVVGLFPSRFEYVRGSLILEFVVRVSILLIANLRDIAI